MENNFNIIILLSEEHNFAFHGFWRTTDISENEICVKSEKPINDLYEVGDIIKVSLFPTGFQSICIKCSFNYINQSEFELRIIDFLSLKDRQLYNKLMANRFYSERDTAYDIILESEDSSVCAH